MNRQQQKTLQRVFEKPERSDIRWSEIESMLTALGAEMIQARGSRVCVVIERQKAVFYRPHPQPFIDKGAVKSLRRFLHEAGVRP